MGAQVTWLDNYDAALDEAAKNSRLVLVDIMADW
jgi:hypothetical protein